MASCLLLFDENWMWVFLLTPMLPFSYLWFKLPFTLIQFMVFVGSLVLLSGDGEMD